MQIENIHKYITLRMDLEEAKEYVEKFNPHNRNRREMNIVKFSRDMLAGNWRLNGQSIIIGSNGVMLDGHNRISAVIEAGKKNPNIQVLFEVTLNVDPESVKTIDICASRNITDSLKMQGYQNASVVGNACVFLWGYEKGYITRAGSSSTQPSTSEVDDVIERNPNILRSVPIGMKLGSAIRSPGAGVFVYHLMSLMDVELADWFVDRYCDYSMLPYDHQISVLKRCIDKCLSSKDTNRSRAHVKGAMLIKTWNMIITDKKTKTINWRFLESITDSQNKAGVKAEKFPEILNPIYYDFDLEGYKSEMADQVHDLIMA